VKVTLMFTVAALASGAAFAQDQAPAATTTAADSSVSSIFMQLDKDKDGKISQAEAQASSVVSGAFSKADADGDGAISRDEFMSSFTSRAPTTPPPAVPTPPSE